MEGLGTVQPKRDCALPRGIAHFTKNRFIALNLSFDNPSTVGTTDDDRLSERSDYALWTNTILPKLWKGSMSPKVEVLGDRKSRRLKPIEIGCNHMPKAERPNLNLHSA